ncbi:MAG: PP2C family protein-serine/threonine phosphatase [Candidatus Kapabacteria bacterium]|nr:PP2C family protein-serine/threonine phosphatase [Candidatus Kapabacteria bacterium]
MLQINLESLIDFSAKLNEINDEKLILNSALLAIMGKLKIVKACVFQKNDKNEYETSIIKGFNPKTENFTINEKDLFEKDFSSNKILKKTGYQYCIPINYNDINFAVICLGKKIDGKKITKIERFYCKLISNITAISLQNVKHYQEIIVANKKLQLRNQLLDTLFEMSKDFNLILSKNEIVKILSFRLMGQLLISRFAIILFDPNENFDFINNRLELKINNQLIKSLKYIKKTQLTNQVNLSKSILKKLTDSGVSVISPLIVQGNLKGILLIGKKLNNEDYTQENLDFIDSLGNLAILALENARLFNEEIEKKRLESELNLAYEIQLNLFPRSIPEPDGYELFGYSIPSRQIGGDYYDFIQIQESKFLVAIADISGKGIPAALLMSNLQASLRTLAPMNLPLKDLLKRLNKVIYDNTTPDKFVTLFCGILDTNNHTFDYINAGHNPPLCYDKSGIKKELTEGGIILGIFDDYDNYAQGHLDLLQGDTIFFYTDGITEARNENEEFSENNLKKILTKNSKASVKKLKEIILENLKNFQGNAPQSDDITMAIIRRKTNLYQNDNH